MYTYIHIDIHIYIYACVCVSVYYIYMYKCLCVCDCMRVYVYMILHDNAVQYRKPDDAPPSGNDLCPSLLVAPRTPHLLQLQPVSLFITYHICRV